MSARIFQPSQNAMQSGKGKADIWVLEFDRQSRRTTEPLMGWTSVDGTQNQVRLKFHSKQDAIDYAERQNIEYSLIAPAAKRKPVKRSYADNFRFGRSANWTH